MPAGATVQVAPAGDRSADAPPTLEYVADALHGTWSIRYTLPLQLPNRPGNLDDAMSEDRLRIEIADHVAVVTLARAGKHNALDFPMFDAIIAAAQRLRTEPGVRAVVLHGDGPSFCSGLDVAAVMSSRPSLADVVAPLHDTPPNYFQRAACDWIAVPVPVIAAIHGHCLGGGLQIALGADIRLATADAKLSVMEVRLGMIPDMSISRTLPRLVGIDVAKELTFTGRVFSGEEAARLGVVTRVSADPLADARALASQIAANSPDAVRGAKRLFDESWTGSAAETLGLEATIQLGLFGTPNQLAAVTATLTKQPAAFTDAG